MTAVKSLLGQKLLVQISDGGSPAVYAHDCLINAERGLALSASRNEFNVPDCDNPDAPIATEGAVASYKGTISGAGMLHTASLEAWFNWFVSGLAKDIRFKADATGANGGGWISGAFHLTSLEVTGNLNDKATVSVTLESSGVLAWTDAA